MREVLNMSARDSKGRWLPSHMIETDPTSHVAKQHVLTMIGKSYMCDCGMMLKGRTRQEAQTYLRIHHQAICELIDLRQVGGSIEYDEERHGR